MKGPSCLLVLVFATSLVACATTVPLTPTSLTPAAAGQVKVSKDSQGNSQLAVDVKYLPKPQDLAPDLTTFVVWAVSDRGDRVRNLGRLNIDQDRNGSVKVTSPLDEFRVVVTAEREGTEAKPSTYVVLNGTVGGH